MDEVEIGYAAEAQSEFQHQKSLKVGVTDMEVEDVSTENINEVTSRIMKEVESIVEVAAEVYSTDEVMAREMGEVTKANLEKVTSRNIDGTAPTAQEMCEVTKANLEKVTSTNIDETAPMPMKDGIEKIDQVASRTRKGEKQNTHECLKESCHENSEGIGDTIMQVEEVIKCENKSYEDQLKNHDMDLSELQKEVLNKLGLTEYFPEKISLQIASQKSLSKVKCLTDIPWWFLTKLLMLDFRVRDDVMSPAVRYKLGIDSESIMENDRKNEYEDIFAELISESSRKRFCAMHPMDIQVTVFRCCSNILRQILSEKMFMCKLSIPLLLPPFLKDKSVFLIWSLRGIVLECKKNDGKVCERTAVCHPNPVVSFVRLGNIFRSKSKILNEFLNGQSHPTFYHRDCDGGMNNRSYSDGLVEVAWSLQSRKNNVLNIRGNVPIDEKKQFQTSDITLLNLRGDGKSLETSISFLSQVSDVVLTMVDIDQLENQYVTDTLNSMLTHNVQLILMLTKQPSKTVDIQKIEKIKSLLQNLECKTFEKENILFDFNAKGEKNIKVLKEEIRVKIDKVVKRIKPKGSLAGYQCQAELTNKIRIDENKRECKEGKDRASQVIEILSSTGKENLRSTKLPLQCKPWQEWSRLNKEEQRGEKRGSVDLPFYVDQIHREKKKWREKQVEMIQKSSELFITFSNNLLKKGGEENLYYLRWLKLEVDNVSREVLPGLQNKVSLKWNEVRQLEGIEKLSDLQKELTQFEEKLAESSLGLEHFFREAAQAYEAVSEGGIYIAKNLKKKINLLPRIMAKLLLLGHPLELMDGDAASVPIKWISAVLDHLKEGIGNEKIFVLSVLGIQSSGKSTLLNTMFGLQFSVAAGRCTRGVYAQLVPIPKEYSESKCSYLLVVDTEGLRAAELGTEKLQHDNEIATLVVGLGDVTIVNIKGENVAEMEDVLQIVVHALLKMKLVNKSLALQPSCFFIHQNVAAPDASQKLRGGQQRFVETLDRVTKAAGRQEDMPHYTKFSQVIEFDINTHIAYFPDLWRGDPPMGHANCGYSESVKEVKETLLRDIVLKRTSYLNINKFSTKVTDLWKGILEQNFVFSFRNSLEMDAYRSLEFKLAELLWALKKTALKWQSGKENEILSNEHGIENLQHSIKSECANKLEETYSKAKEMLKDFFHTHEDSKVMELWRVRTFKKMEKCYEDIIDRTSEALRSKIKAKLIETDQRNSFEKYRTDIMEKAKKYAEELRLVEGEENLNDQKLEECFVEMWNEWERALPVGHEDSINIEAIIKKVLYDKFIQDSPIVRKALEGLLKDDELAIRTKLRHTFEKHVSMNKVYFYIFRLGAFAVPGDNYVNDLFKEVGKYVENTKGQGLQPKDGKALISKAKELINRLKKECLTIKREEEFEMSIALFICQYASLWYCRRYTLGIEGNTEIKVTTHGIHPCFEKELAGTYSSDQLSPLVSSLLIKSSLISMSKHDALKTKICEQFTEKFLVSVLSKLEKEVESYMRKPEIQDFREEYVEEILNKASLVMVKEKGSKELKIMVCTYVCYFALPLFIKKHQKFADNLNPRKVMKRDYYYTYLQMFKNSYRKVTDEMALTMILGERLSTAIEMAVSKALPVELADIVKNNVPELNIKSSLLKAILIQLLEKDDFDEFMLYLENINASYEKWISYFIDRYLFAEEYGCNNQYTVTAFSILQRLISKVCDDVYQTVINSESENIQELLPCWIREFHKRISSKIPVPLYDLSSLINGHEILSLDSFVEGLQKCLQKSSEKIKENFQSHNGEHMRSANSENVYDLMYTECKGCTEQCPFCSAPCTLNTAGHIQQGEGVKHVSKEHYPLGCGRFRYEEDEELIIENCSMNLAGDGKFQNSQTAGVFHYYKNYQKFYPDWKIDGDLSMEASPYWKWFLVKYESQLAKRYIAKRPTIPDSWRSITKDMARESVDA